VRAWNSQIVCNALCDRWELACCFPNGDREESVLGNVFAVAAIRAIVDEPRPIDAEEPNSDKGDDGHGNVLLAFHLNA
jgi:hypothetical protein